MKPNYSKYQDNTGKITNSDRCVNILFYLLLIDIVTAGILNTVQNSMISTSSSIMFSREPFLYKNEIHWMIALHFLQKLRGNRQNMFSGNKCYKIWLLCTCCRNHPESISKVALQAFRTFWETVSGKVGLYISCLYNKILFK